MNVERKKTQGETKMIRYIDDLVRNEEFKRDMKLMEKYRKEMDSKDLDYKELNSIIASYEKLKKRSNKVFKDKFLKKRNEISEKYLIDSHELFYAEALLNPQKYKSHDIVGFMKSLADPDMCKLVNMLDDELNPENKGDEIIYLNPNKQSFLNAYPVAICIHPRASKRDVLDFVEKRWKWIEPIAAEYAGYKKLKYGKRKFKQELLDFIWENRTLPTKQLLSQLETQFPGNQLVYYELRKLIQLEANKRIGSLS
jgi:hypothetical protein